MDPSSLPRPQLASLVTALRAQLRALLPPLQVAAAGAGASDVGREQGGGGDGGQGWCLTAAAPGAPDASPHRRQESQQLVGRGTKRGRGEEAGQWGDVACAAGAQGRGERQAGSKGEGRPDPRNRERETGASQAQGGGRRRGGGVRKVGAVKGAVCACVRCGACFGRVRGE